MNRTTPINSRTASLLARLLQISFYLWIIASVILLLMFLLTAGTANYTLNLPVRLELDPQSYALKAPGLQLTDLTLRDLIGNVVVPGDQIGRWFALLGFFALLVSVAAWGWANWALWKLFASIAGGQPFILGNVLRLRFVGWLLVAYYFLGLVGVWIQRWLGQQVIAEGAISIHQHTVWTISFSSDVANILGNNGLLVVGLAILALAEVFRYAMAVFSERDELRREQELMV
ncbi:DUF2975 domain-containing protein [uncultured Meiothermus sp.]|jgi:hypothetical protein|uniref:DUF2975 domain-containing protein n=1 Tax=uncultured Meiothermus sp. TaxID=157471 RepID=UPI002607618E|nr:DUF2975 domain-containing protein [uncultured Meiothermus sp.]